MKRFLFGFWRNWVRPMAIPVLLITAAKSAIADINVVPSGSMKPTILVGDVVFVNKLAYDLKVPFTQVHLAEWSSPVRGAIVVCFSPADGTRLVKRVIGLPGDVIELRRNRVVINGQETSYTILEPSADGIRDLPSDEIATSIFAREQLPGRTHEVMGTPALPAPRNFGPVTVPAGQYLMLGDSRDNSLDSRYFGFIDRREIVGEAVGVFVSADPSRYLEPRFNRFFTPLH